MLHAPFQPTIRIMWLINELGYNTQIQGRKRIDHDCQFLCALGSQAFLDCAGVGAVWDAAWMEGDRGAFDAFAASEVAVDVVEHLVAVDIAMIIRNWDGEWVVVELAGY